MIEGGWFQRRSHTFSNVKEQKPASAERWLKSNQGWLKSKRSALAGFTARNVQAHEQLKLISSSTLNVSVVP
jgi:hypothetical protein